MSRTKYLIIGSSHAGLSAAESIRLYDRDGTVTMISAEKAWPYSPTILPYVVSGKVHEDRIFLRDQAWFDKRNIRFINGSRVTGINRGEKSVTVESGGEISYEKLLLATGAAPDLPPIPGLMDCPYYTLRTVEDALRIRASMQKGRSAVVLGAGLIGMHAAENMARAGLKVTVVEMLPQVLPGYFDLQAAGLIRKVFTENGVNILTGNPVTSVTSARGACTVSLQNGLDLTADILLAATGVRPRISFLEGSSVRTDAGVLVDERMRTNVQDIWAAGDVARAASFLGAEKILNGIVPDAVEQGRIAGMDMAADPSLKPYAGGIAMNTYCFFGNRSFSVGSSLSEESEDGREVDRLYSPAALKYHKLVFRDGRLIGAAAINAAFDPGIVCRMIRGRVELGERKRGFAASPLEYGRLFMSRLWR
ncbi:MAG: NAD(P)/FAD-dependent oxidoreductase [Deltaproteobacteria bacterium]|jgi:phenylglyoxylate dehydrogenase epsilon subunit|nr:NAD(P)/FAD-dependent oxidoreductase [Deltaproteobacteria bacterium]